MSKGDVMTPARFWSYIVCEESEREQLERRGYVVSRVRNYLDPRS